MNPQLIRTVSGLAIAAFAGIASAQITPIFTNIVGAPGNEVPGYSNGWKPGTTTQFDRAYVSPDGTKWILGGFANEAATNDEIVVVGSGPTRTGALVIMQEQATLIGGIAQPQLIDQQMSINNAGQAAIAVDLTGGTANDESIIKYDPGSGLSIVAIEGSPYGTLFSGVPLSSILDSPSITADGTVGFKAYFASTAPITATTRYALVLGDSVIAQEGVTIPNGATAAWDLFDAGTFFISDDGNQYIVVGDDESATTNDGIMVRNDTVVFREGEPVVGGIFQDSIVQEIAMSRDGNHWIIRGITSAGTDFVFVDSIQVAGTDEAITPGSAEFYDDALFSACFFSIAINNNGDYVVGGVTTALDVNANAVLVLNGQTVVVREGDPVDLNENGDPNDDGVFISVFNNDDAFLTDDLGYYFMADLRDGTGTNIGQAFLYLDLSGLGSTCPPCAADYDNNGGVDGGDLAAFFADFETGAQCADVDQNGGVDGGDLAFFFLVFEQGGCN